MNRPTHPRIARGLALALLIGSGLIQGAVALTPIAPIAPANAAWPEPAPADVFARRPAVRPLPDRPGAPWFQAPAATHCARPPALYEERGAADGPPVAIARRSPGRAIAPAPSAARAETAAASVAPAPPATARAKSSAPPVLADAATTAPASPPITRAAGRHPMPPSAPADTPVTAGVVDDNADFAAYQAFRARTQVPHRARSVDGRTLLQVRDARGQPVPDAEVAVRSAAGAAMWARTDSGGRAWLHPQAFDAVGAAVYEVTVRHGAAQATAFWRRDQASAIDVTLDAAAPPARARLDLAFLIDATGSMGDEITRLKTTLREIAADVARLPSRPDTCFGLVAYRDKGDAFVLRSHDFTGDLQAFQRVLDGLQADGGGDYPEAMNEALHEAVQQLSWRGAGATRLLVLLADAPPHLDYAGPQYDHDMQAALGKGIKIFSVGASGLDKQGEFIQRQIAQYTGGRFVFLTYQRASDPASGPGRETVHDVKNYSVETLDRLIVRLITEELAQRPTGRS